MNSVLRSLGASTVLVLAYPIVVVLVLAPFAILLGGPYIDGAMEALMLPMGLPFRIMDVVYPNAPLLRRPVLFVLVWFLAFNATLYYVPVKLILEWREHRVRLR